MKKTLKMVAMTLLTLLFFVGSATAANFTWDDYTIAWPGYYNSAFPNDQMGVPKVASISATTYESGNLASVTIQMYDVNSIWLVPAFLYVNTSIDGNRGYEGWDYYVANGVWDAVGNKWALGSNKLYEVEKDYEYKIVDTNGRVGHPSGIIDGVGTTSATSAYFNGVEYKNATMQIVYNFNEGIHIATGDRFDGVLGWTNYCANDVILTPEPGTLLLLGLGLLGVGIVSRKKIKVS